METDLKGKKVVVTGSTDGIGLAIVEAFLKEGSNVIINSRSKEKVEKAVSEMQKKYPQTVVKGIAADVGTLDGAELLYMESIKDGDIDILVNNVGIYGVVPFAELTDEIWMNIYSVNVLSIVRLARLLLPNMLKRNSGKIINIGSEAGIRANKDMAHYSASKAAGLSLTKSLAEMTKGTKVTVNSILPSATMTPGVKDYLETIAKRDGLTLEEAKVEYFANGTDSPSLLQRFLTPEEVAMTVIFTAANDGINGSNILMDAGIIKHI
ncbi:MAG: hypothetical protein CVU84_00870 [Firmicutes bacterium HGW-Firmicutes-1]|jgi:NAD(P)-dependent dehydrogenase (short-subunit alcohol dehydrogenase family)|nr:MAG: hypothetical protein CVU84_00870 [Firmicutes bacterium HGW-Firmicutes-1]